MTTSSAVITRGLPGVMCNRPIVTGRPPSAAEACRSTSGRSQSGEDSAAAASRPTTPTPARPNQRSHRSARRWAMLHVPGADPWRRATGSCPGRSAPRMAWLLAVIGPTKRRPPRPGRLRGADGSASRWGCLTDRLSVRILLANAAAGAGERLGFLPSGGRRCRSAPSSHSRPCPRRPSGSRGPRSAPAIRASCCATASAPCSRTPTSPTSSPGAASRPTRRGGWPWSRCSSSAQG
jgi:hypothetical protein